MRRAGTISAIIIAPILAALPAEAFGQSLADIARQEKARRQAIESKSVITNDTIRREVTTPPATERAPAAAAPQPPADSRAAASPVVNGREPQRDEAWWRAAFQEARAELARAEANVQRAQLDMNRISTEYLTRSDVYDRETRLGQERATVANELQAAQAAVEQSRQKIADLEDELRRSGGLPAWSR